MEAVSFRNYEVSGRPPHTRTATDKRTSTEKRRWLIVATNNQGKLRELRQPLAGLGLKIVSPHEVGVQLEVSEVGTTFAENAALKAVACARATNLLSLADDSGLEVDALQGAPGVYSARYAGPEASDDERIALLLANLRGIPLQERTARFRCAIAVAPPEGHVFLAEGVCHGLVALVPAGHRGFGYDPVFYLPALRKTLAQIPQQLKRQISHRALAAVSIRPTLARLARNPLSS